MESQMAASWATEMGIAENTEFEAYGAKYRYKNVVGAEGLTDGRMNCKVFKVMQGTCKSSAEGGTTYDIEVCLRMSLYNGMNLSGDIFAYWGGGCEMVGTNKKTTNENYNDDRLKLNFVDFYLESNQSKWVKDASFSKSNLGTFGFESVYAKIGTFGPPILSNGYAKTRLGFTPYKTAYGGGLSSYQCFYTWAYPYWSKTLNERVRIGLRLRGHSHSAACSSRHLHCHYSVGSTDSNYGCSALCRIAEKRS